MIRALFLVLALVLGLAAALVSQARMYHLRYLVPDRLPGWTQAIAGESGLFRGRVRLPASGASATWRAIWPGADGLRWRVGLIGGGLDLSAVARLPFDASGADLSDISGTIALDQLAGQDAAGLVDLSGGSAKVEPLPEASQISGAVEGEIRGAAFQSVSLGGGPLSATMAPLGSYRVSFTLTGGALEAEGEVTGRLGRDEAALDVTLTETGEDIPEAWRNALTFAGQRTESGWVVQQGVPLRGMLPSN